MVPAIELARHGHAVGVLVREGLRERKALVPRVIDRIRVPPALCEGRPFAYQERIAQGGAVAVLHRPEGKGRILVVATSPTKRNIIANKIATVYPRSCNKRWHFLS